MARCDCGTEKLVRPANLANGNTKSCGCLRKERGPRSIGWRGAGAVPGTILAHIHHRSRHTGHEVTVTIEYLAAVYEQQGRRCALTGWEIGFGGETTASVDRIDSERGYVPGNVQWLHKDINKMKLDHTLDHFLRMCRAVAEHCPPGEQLTLLQGGKYGR